MNNSNQGVGLSIKTNASQASTELDKVLEKLTLITEQIDKLIINTEKTTKKTKKATDNLDKTLKNLNFDTITNNISKLTRTVDKFASGFVNYIEDLNLLKVAFGETADEAKDMVESIASITGFDEATLVRMTATFRQLSSTLGLTNQDADLLSSNLTKMALDVSSLYNLDLDTAKYALQGALTAQPRSIKTHTGADVTQATLQAELARLGIDRKVRSLNQAEKAIITYLSLERQLINSNGDLARTIEQPANMLKIFREQLTRAGRSIGNLFLPLIKTVIPYLTAFLMVFSEIVDILVSFLGIDVDSFWEGMESGSSNIISGLDGITESAKKAQTGLRGFDKLNVIKTPSSGSDGSGLGLGVDSRLLDALSEYDLKLDNIRTKATEIRDRIMEWLGFTKQANGEFKFTNITWGTIFASVLGIVGLLGALGKVFGVLKNIGALFTGTKGLATLFGAGGATATASTWGTLGAVIGGALSGLGQGLLIVAGVIAGTYALLQLFGGADFDDDLIQVDKLEDASEETQKHLGDVQTAVDGVVDAIHNVDWNDLALDKKETKKITKSITDLTKTLKTKLKTYVDESLKQLNYLYENGFISKDEYDEQIRLLDDYQNTQLSKINNQNDLLIQKSETLFDEQGNLIIENYAEFIDLLEKYESDSLTSLTYNYQDLLTIQKNAEGKSEKQKREYYSELLKQYAQDRDNAKTKAQEKYQNTIDYASKIYGKESEMYKQIEAKAKETRDKEITDADNAYNEIYNKLASTTSNMSMYIDRDDGHLKSSWEIFWDEFEKGAKRDLEDLKAFFGLNPIKVQADVTKAMKTISDWFGKIKNIKFSLDKGFYYETTWKTVVDQSFGNGGGGGFRADGGFVDTGQLFVAREAGPELVGSIGNKTAVANNDQIVDAVAQGVTNAIIASGGFGKDVVIEAHGDADGMMNFITFKQKEQDMQYGN